VTLESHLLMQMAGWSLLATFLIISLDFMQRITQTTSLTFVQWLICIVVSSLIVWTTELAKIYRRRVVGSTAVEPEKITAPQTSI